jgi:hypothetical protein
VLILGILFIREQRISSHTAIFIGNLSKGSKVMISFRGEGSDKNQIKIREICGCCSIGVEVSVPWACYAE